jgi:DNA-binding transcriptional ArsR family regulator
MKYHFNLYTRPMLKFELDTDDACVLQVIEAMCGSNSQAVVERRVEKQGYIWTEITYGLLKREAPFLRATSKTSLSRKMTVLREKGLIAITRGQGNRNYYRTTKAYEDNFVRKECSVDETQVLRQRNRGVASAEHYKDNNINKQINNTRKPSLRETAERKKKLKEEKRKQHMDMLLFLDWLKPKREKDRATDIIAWYAEQIKPKYSNRLEWDGFFSRNIKIANKLTDYSEATLNRGVDALKRNLSKNGGYITKWTLETLEKELDHA